MRSWGLAAATALLALVSGVLAFLHLEQIDAKAPLGFQTQVWVRAATPQADPEELAESIAAFAEQHQVNVARVRPSTDDALSSRHLYIAAGRSGSEIADWLTEGYPAFSRNAETFVHPWAELDFEETDPRGYYLLAAPTDVGRELAETIRSTGFVAEAHPFRDMGDQVAAFVDNGAAVSLLIATLVAVVLVGATVLLGAKTYGIARLHGHGFRWMLARDLARAAPGVASALVLVTGIAAACLGVYNGLNQFAMFARLAALVLAVGFACTLGAHVAAVWLTTRSDIIAAIKGRIPDRATLVSAYALRVSAAFLAVQAVAMAVHLHGPAQEAAHDLEVGQRHAGEAAYLLLNGTLGDSRQLRESVASWLQRANEEGRVVLAEVSSLHQPRTQAQFLTVNPTYLREQTIVTAEGERLAAGSLPEDRPTLLIPENSDNEVVAAVSQAVEEKLAFARKRSGAAEVPEPARVQIASGQELFTYSEPHGFAPATVTNAFVLVVPPELQLWGRAWISMADDVVLLESGLMDEAQANPELPAGTLATQPVVEVLAGTARDAYVRWWTALMNAFVAVVLLLAAVAATVAVYVRGWAMRLFVRFAHGWSRWRASPVLMISEAAVVALLVGYGVVPWLSELVATPRNPSIPAPPSIVETIPAEVTLVASTAIAVAAAAAAAWVLRVRERRILSDRAIDRM